MLDLKVAMKWYMVCVSKAVQLLRFYGFLAKERDGNEICLLLIRNGFELSKRFSDSFLTLGQTISNISSKCSLNETWYVLTVLELGLKLSAD